MIRRKDAPKALGSRISRRVGTLLADEIRDDDGAHSLGQKQSDQTNPAAESTKSEALGSSVEYEDSYRRAKRRIISQITERRPDQSQRPTAQLRAGTRGH